jgi:hypothetical protein
LTIALVKDRHFVASKAETLSWHRSLEKWYFILAFGQTMLSAMRLGYFVSRIGL